MWFAWIACTPDPSSLPPVAPSPPPPAPTLALSARSVGGEATDSAAIGDVTGDGWPDLLAVQGVEVRMLTGPIGVGRSFDDPDALLPYEPRRLGAPTSVAILGDLDQDGADEAAVSLLERHAMDKEFFDGGSAVVHGPLGDGALPWVELLRAPDGVGANPIHAAVGDVDGDGLADFAVATPITGQVFLSHYPARGDYAFPGSWAETTLTASALAPVGDVDGDGTIDLAVTASDGLSTR